MRQFSLPLLALAMFGTQTLADNISIRLGYSDHKDGLAFSALRAETGQFALSPTQPDHLEGAVWRVIAKDVNGKIVHETSVKDGTQIHVEAFDPQTGKVAHSGTIHRPSGVFEVSLPFSSNITSVEVVPAQGMGKFKPGVLGSQGMTADRAPIAHFDRSALQNLVNSNNRSRNVSAQATTTPKATATTIIDNGPSATRMDYVFVGDGYTAAEMDKWKSDAQKVISGFMADPLFAANRNSMNVRRVDVASNQSGVSEPDKGITKDTAMDGAFNCYKIDRLLCMNDTKVLNIVGSVLAPDARDIIVVVSNSTRYGGSGGDIATLSMNAQSTEIALHEIGHTAFKLADEYDYGTCDLSTEPTEGDVSRVATRSVKWGSLIAASTAVPTAAGAYPNGTVGVFQGAQYCTSGKYRPTENSRMRTLGYPWHSVNEGLARKVFAMYTGASSSGVTQSGTLAQGGSVFVPSASPNYVQGGSGTYSVSLTGPSGTNFNLELYKLNGSTWTKVASSSNAGSSESISYVGTAGYYYARVVSASGSGNYTVTYNFPKP
ncbi:M64 family metallopeptidase [Burkholderiaceae bacterium DAT-1]|nr:M64 family metallopeptidase [Burkholderiaceae bacterium DAT-1]